MAEFARMNAADLKLSENHTYSLEGRQVPGVTSILDSFGLAINKELVNPVVLAQARWRGTSVHKLTAYYDNGVLKSSVVQPGDIGDRVLQYIKFRRESGFEPELTECRLFSEKYWYAGTLDRVGDIGGVKSLIDIKTVTAGPGAGPQTAAYQVALKESYGIVTLRRYALVLQPDRYELVKLDAQDDWAIFMAALTLTHWKTKRNLP
ncbi:MAG: hypothetical protein ACREJM_15095 [Candidatus Saccharimonadales bacterium]